MAQTPAEKLVEELKASSTRSIELWINGRPKIVSVVNPEASLLEYLRAEGLTGTKLGCGEVSRCPRNEPTNGQGSRSLPATNQ
jgi:hypothetical protein